VVDPRYLEESDWCAYILIGQERRGWLDGKMQPSTKRGVEASSFPTLHFGPASHLITATRNPVSASRQLHFQQSNVPNTSIAPRLKRAMAEGESTLLHWLDATVSGICGPIETAPSQSRLALVSRRLEAILHMGATPVSSRMKILPPPDAILPDHRV